MYRTSSLIITEAILRFIKRQWHRVVSDDEATARLERFFDQLHGSVSAGIGQTRQRLAVGGEIRFVIAPFSSRPLPIAHRSPDDLRGRRHLDMPDTKFRQCIDERI